jgi:hypothetical protein
MALTLCTMCERHVRVTEERCPFCDAEVDARGANVNEPRRTHATRAMAFAAIALTVSCEKKKEPPVEAPVTTSSAAASTSSSVAPVESVSASAPDASAPDAEAPDAAGTAPGGLHLINVGKPAGTTFKKKQPPPPPNLAKPYGAPPADGLLV